MAQKVQPRILERYELVRKIGSGAYGHVWKVVDRRTKRIVALKKIFDAFQHSTDAQRTYRQIMFLQEFDHDNIIKLIDVIRAQNDQDIYLVFEFMEIDLHSVIRQGILKDKHKQFIVYQIAKAIKYLHSTELLHRDLKPSNVLINSECKVKLCDFGLIRSLEKNAHEEDIILTEYVATRWYRAPEILMGSQSYTKGVDIWSFGCLVAEMIKGKPLFAGTSTIDQLEKVLTWTGMPKRSDIEALGAEVSLSILGNMGTIKSKGNHDTLVCEDKLALDLILKTLQFNPKKRITIEEVLKHPYLREFHDPSKQPICERPIKISISDNKKLSTKEYRALIYKEISRVNFNKNKATTQPSQTKPTITSSITSVRSVRRKSLRTSTKPSDDEQVGLSVGTTTVCVKKDARNLFTSTPKVNIHSSQTQAKKYQALRTKLLTESREDYNSACRGNSGSVYGSKKHSLQGKERHLQRITSGIQHRKRTQSVYSSSKKATQIPGKNINLFSKLS